MKIIFISSGYPPVNRGGAEMAVARVAEGFARIGDEVAVIALHAGADERIEETNGIRVYRLPIDNFYWTTSLTRRRNWVMRCLWHWRDRWNRKAAERVGRILERERPDIVNTHTVVGLSNSVWEEVKRRGLPLVHTTHDYYLMCVRSGIYHRGRICKRRCLVCQFARHQHRAWSSKIDGFIAVSEFVLNKHRKERYFVGVPSSVIRPIYASDLSQVAGIPPADTNVLTFGFIGQLTMEKGIVELLEATRQLETENWRLKIAGVGHAKFVDRLKDKYRDQRIEFLGFCKQKDFYGAVDVVILPSVWPEPGSIVPVESFAANRSLICARSGGIPEMAPLGKVVAVYDPQRPDGLSGAMNAALREPERWRRGRFREPDSGSEFSEAVVVRRYREVFQQLCAGQATATRP